MKALFREVTVIYNSGESIMCIVSMSTFLFLSFEMCAC